MKPFPLMLALALSCAFAAPAFAEDKPAPAADTAAPAAQTTAKKKKRRKAQTQTQAPAGRTGLARVSGSLEQRHQVCLAFIRRHNLDCDPWQTPTCGADTGYFRPPECVRPRSQQ